MPEDFADHDSPPTQPAPARIPPGSPPSTAAGVEELPAPARGGWGLLDALPVMLFLLLLSAASLMSSPEQPGAGVRAVLVMQSFLYLLILLYIYTIVRLKHRLPFWTGLGWPRAPGTASTHFLLAGAALALLVQVVSLPVKNKLPIERLFQNQEAAFLLAAFGILVAPFVEEVIFRGFLFAAVERSFGLRPAVWMTSLLFATIHIPQLRGGGPQVLAIFGVGLALSWIRGRTGSLAPPYYMHLAYNTTLFAMLYFATQGFRQFG